MIIVEKSVEAESLYDLSRLADPAKTLLFDIETTGLSPHGSSVYLIGCLYQEKSTEGSTDQKKPTEDSADPGQRAEGSCESVKNCWRFVQWFSESFQDEMKVLSSFFELCQNFDTLLHFNGDTFDIPYLETTAKMYGLASPLSKMNSIDLLKLVRHKKRLFGLDHYKLKCIEQFLGIYREDQFTGGELIEVYEHFVKTQDPEEKRLLLLHNEDDLIGMLKVLPIVNYTDLIDRPEFSICRIQDHQEENFLLVEAETKDLFPAALSYETVEGILFTVKDHRLTFRIPVFQGELFYYYPNFKEYWYLPLEDLAIHKKLAAFVDKDHRIPATRETARAPRSGSFYPAVKNYPAPVLKVSYADREGYMEVPETDLATYLKDLLLSV